MRIRYAQSAARTKGEDSSRDSPMMGLYRCFGPPFAELTEFAAWRAQSSS
jgi:hypothetical protein